MPGTIPIMSRFDRYGCSAAGSCPLGITCMDPGEKKTRHTLICVHMPVKYRGIVNVWLIQCLQQKPVVSGIKLKTNKSKVPHLLNAAFRRLKARRRSGLGGLGAPLQTASLYLGPCRALQCWIFITRIIKKRGIKKRLHLGAQGTILESNCFGLEKYQYCMRPFINIFSNKFYQHFETNLSLAFLDRVENLI